MDSPQCVGCNLDCEIVYDSHHGEYFSLSCGKVVMSMGVFTIPYEDDLDLIFQKYEERFAKRRKAVKDKEDARKRRNALKKG